MRCESRDPVCHLRCSREAHPGDKEHANGSLLWDDDGNTGVLANWPRDTFVIGATRTVDNPIAPRRQRRARKGD